MRITTSLGRRFWQLWTANTISSVGDGMVLVALPLLAVGTTHNPLAVAGVMAVGEVPVVLASLPVGAVADRVNRRRMLVRVEIIRFAALAIFGVLVLSGLAGLVGIYIAALVFGTLDVFFDVTSSSLVPAIVAKEHLGAANNQLMNAQAVGQDITGRAAGGALLGVARSLPFLADAATFVASAVLLSAAVPDEGPVVTRPTSTWADLRAGISWYFRHGTLRRLTLLVASLAFCQSMVMALTALWARDDLHLSQAGYGLLLGVAAVGNFVGVGAARHLRRHLSGAATIVLVGLLAAGAYPVMAVTHSALVAAGALALEAATVVTGNGAAATMRQTLLPPDMQARGVAAYRTVILGCLPFGGILGGVVASLAGIRTTFVIAGGLQLGFIVLVGPVLLRYARRPMDPPATIDLTDRPATSEPATHAARTHAAGTHAPATHAAGTHAAATQQAAMQQPATPAVGGLADDARPTTVA